MSFDTTTWINFLTAIVLLLSFVTLLHRELENLLRLYTAQAAVSGIIAILIATQLDATHLWATALSTLIAKAVVIPIGLRILLGRMKHARRVPLTINGSWLAILGGAMVGFAYFIMTPVADALPATAEWQLIGAMAIALQGLIMVIGHRSAIGQIIGFLTMENGVLLLSVATTLGWPAFVELGLLIDILLGISLLSVFVARMDSTIQSIDTQELSELTDD